MQATEAAQDPLPRAPFGDSQNGPSHAQVHPILWTPEAAGISPVDTPRLPTGRRRSEWGGITTLPGGSVVSALTVGRSVSGAA